MGYGSMTQTQGCAKKNFKFGRKIAKCRKPEGQNLKERHMPHKFHNKKHIKLHYTQALSPSYMVSQPVRIRPLSYSDEYKPDTACEQQTKQIYTCYIDSLLILKMQRQQQRNQELIQQLSNIKFEETC